MIHRTFDFPKRNNRSGKRSASFCSSVPFSRDWLRVILRNFTCSHEIKFVTRYQQRNSSPLYIYCSCLKVNNGLVKSAFNVIDSRVSTIIFHISCPALVEKSSQHKLLSFQRNFIEIRIMNRIIKQYRLILNFSRYLRKFFRFMCLCTSVRVQKYCNIFILFKIIRI